MLRNITFCFPLAILMTIFISSCSNTESKSDNPCEDIKKLEEATKKGDEKSQFQTAYCYYYGDKVDKDFKKAFDLWKDLADKGNKSAQKNIGEMYFDGEGVGKDYDKAKEYFTQSAQQGSSVGQYNLGYMYYHGYGVQKNFEKARDFFEKASIQGDAGSLFYMGLIYDNGFGAKKDIMKALEYYTKASDLGNALAQYNIAHIYYHGEGVVKKDYKKAIEFYTKSAEGGFHNAQLNLGYLYSEGKGVKRDLLKAAELYKKAADQGNEKAQNNLKNKIYTIVKPFNLQIGHVTLENAKNHYKLIEEGVNKWTGGLMFNISPISQVDFEGVNEITLIFDQMNVLQGVVAKFHKGDFYSLKELLENKYHTTDVDIKRVGDKFIRFRGANGSVSLDAPHMSHNLSLNFFTDEFENNKKQVIQEEKSEKIRKKSAQL